MQIITMSQQWIYGLAVCVSYPAITSPIIYARCMWGEALVQLVCCGSWLVRPRRQVGIDAISRLLA